jgi:hypothetical protein
MSVSIALVGCSNGPEKSTSQVGGQSGATATGGAGGSSSGQGGQQGQGGAGGIATGGSGGGGGQAAGQGGSIAGSGGSSGGSNGSDGGRPDASPISDGSAADGGTGEWRDLFNGTDLTGWIPSPNCAPIFTAGTLDGEGVIHVYPTQADQSTQPQCTLRTTDTTFSRYVFHVEYKWGTKRYSDRSQTFRDNGVLYHITNSLTAVWPDSLEFQIGSSPLGGDWITGDIFMLNVGVTRADWPNMNGMFSENGTRTKIGPGNNRGRVAMQLNKDTDWNVIELTVHGSTDSEYKVNGTVVNRLYNFEYNSGGTFRPLDHGPLALQAEFAEVYFRNIRIQLLP